MTAITKHINFTLSINVVTNRSTNIKVSHYISKHKVTNGLQILLVHIQTSASGEERILLCLYFTSSTLADISLIDSRISSAFFENKIL